MGLVLRLNYFQTRFISYIFWVALAAVACMAAPASVSAATLSLSPSTGSFAAGDTFEVKILLNTSGNTTSGTDAYVRFDPNSLQVVDANSSAEGTQILPGSLYSQTSYNQVDTSTGKISFSGSKSGGSPGYKGTGTLATITFSAVKQISTTPVTFDFTSGSTTDSNVIDQTSSDDVLTSVTDASYTVTAAKAATTTGTTGTTDDTVGSDGSSTTGGTGSGSDGTAGTGAGGKSGTDGAGGTTDVAATGMDLNGYLLITILSMLGAGYFLTRRPKAR